MESDSFHIYATIYSKYVFVNSIIFVMNVMIGRKGGLFLDGSKKWLRKSLVVLVTILTFGLVTPSDFTWFAEAHPLKDSNTGTQEDNELSYSPIDEPRTFDRSQCIAILKDKAEENASQKFGEKIQPKINNEFKEMILPKIEVAIEEMASQFPDDQLQSLTISEKPGGGRSEKIFHIYDSNSGKDIIRFHVRQDHIPLEGYWFNFHYHTYHDSFSSHYELGSIYWDTNTPPKWGGTSIIS